MVEESAAFHTGQADTKIQTIDVLQITYWHFFNRTCNTNFDQTAESRLNNPRDEYLAQWFDLQSLLAYRCSD